MTAELLQKVKVFRDKAIATGHLAGKPLFFPDGLERMSLGELIAERDRLKAEVRRNLDEAHDLRRIAYRQEDVASALSDLIDAMGKEGE